MWRFLKKILRTIALWLPLVSLLILNVSALDPIETIPLYPYIGIMWSETAQNQAYVRASNSLPVVSPAGNGTNYRGYLTYQSALDKDTFYHLKFDVNNVQDMPDIPTGVITNQGGDIQTLLFPANTLSPYASDIANSVNQTKIINWSKDSAFSNNMASYVGAKTYYYFTKTSSTSFTIDVVMYFNDEFFTYGWNYNASATRYMQCYIGVVFPWTRGMQLNNVEVFPVGGSDYNGKLDRIISLLQAQGGGLSREDIQAATLAALEQHDAAEEQKGNNKIQQIKQQIESITEPYKENLTTLQDSMRSITGALNYSGTSAILTLPEARNPMTNNSLLWEQKQIDLAAYWDMLPAALRSAISIVLSFVILYKVIMEMIDEITWVIYMDKNVDKAERGGITI